MFISRHPPFPLFHPASSTPFTFLEGEHLVLHLADSPRLLVSQLIEVLLASIHHRWWSTHQNLNIISRCWEELLDSLLCDEPLLSDKVGRWFVEEVQHPESVRVVSCQLVQLITKKNVTFRDIGIDEINLCLVLWVLQRCTDNLQTWSEASSTCDHAQSSGQFRVVAHLALWTLDLDWLSDFESIEDFGNVTVWVRLDDQIKETQVVVGRSRRVGTLDILAVNLGLNGNVLADGKTEDGVGLGQTETVEGSVVGDFFAFDEVEILPYFGIQDWLWLCAGGVVSE